MELQQFISNTLVQIANGIQDAAHELAKSKKAIVNPRNVATSNMKDSDAYGILVNNKKFYKAVRKVDFDVAVTAGEGTEKKTGIGIQVGSISLGAKGKSENQNSTVSRIKFSVPIVLPMTDAQHDPNDPDSGMNSSLDKKEFDSLL